jgi:hypothetical protein
MVVGTPYSYQLSTSFVAPALTWSVTQGTPPPGVVLSPTGLLAGTPGGSGHFSFTVTGANGFAPPITKTFTTNGPAVFRPASGVWFFQGGGATAFGTDGDIPVPGDYDGDGIDSAAVFRPSQGVWFIEGAPSVAWGTAGDIPVPGDYDGDGDDDIAVFRPSSGVWFVQGAPAVVWGANGDIPVAADYDGDGDDDIAVFRPSVGQWFVRGGVGPTGNTGFSTPVPASSTAIGWGIDGDVPVPGDYDNNGIADIAVYRPSSGSWFIRLGLPDQPSSPNRGFSWGLPTDIPVAADYNGDGAVDVAVYRPSTGEWFVLGGLQTAWGTTGDLPVPGYYFN